jgi:hypothetical protein
MLLASSILDAAAINVRKKKPRRRTAQTDTGDD